jgi:hypothetical protein
MTLIYLLKKQLATGTVPVEGTTKQFGLFHSGLQFLTKMQRASRNGNGIVTTAGMYQKSSVSW